MKDNILKKEFAKKDVQRLRNVLKGKAGERTVDGIGYTKTHEVRKEGDVWTENGREWTIKDGIKQNITKLDKAKKIMNLPLFCPSCSKVMNHKYDKSFYLQYRRCWDCQIDFEADLRKKGLLKEYEKFVLNSDIDALIEDFTIWTDEKMNQSANSFVSEAGEVQQWTQFSKKQILQDKEKTLEYLESLKKQ